MTLRADPTFLVEMSRFGAFDVNACFNCGNCTAVCPLSKGNDAFPRRMIRYAQLGLPDHLVASKELWLCHDCGECSVTCPRQAKPGEFMASARRFAIARLAPTALARKLYTSPAWAAGALVLVAALLAGLFLAWSPGIPEGRFTTARMLEFVPYEVIHLTGVAVFVFLGLVTLGTVISMAWSFSRAPVPGGVGAPGSSPGLFPFGTALRALREALAEVLGHRSFRSCGTEDEEKDRPWPLRRWFLHFSMMAGFLGLFLATGLDYLLKDPNRHVPPWSPIRLLGTVAGALFLYGGMVTLVRRIGKRDRASSRSRASDWTFLGLLLATGLTGFLIEAAIYLDLPGGPFLYGAFLVHLVLAMELLVLFPFTKFAHAVYRPVALWIHAFRALRAGG
jgi:ferredoxin